MATVKLAYRFALDPTPGQERALRSHAGAARFAWNWGLHQCKERYAVDRKWYSATELHKLWNVTKKADPALGWWAENSKCVYQEAFRNLDRALSDFVKSRRGERKGKRLGFPRFKKRGKARDSFRLTGTIRCDGNTVRLPRLGVIATCEPTGKLAGRVADGAPRVLSATVSRAAQRWYVSFTVEEDREVPARHARPGSAAWRGGTLITADRFYPSSKKCSGCGAVKARLALSERTYTCGSCGLVIDRDVNAARNLLSLAASGAESLNARGAAVRPGPAGHAAVKREPGTPPGGKTGTAAPQQAAAA